MSSPHGQTTKAGLQAGAPRRLSRGYVAGWIGVAGIAVAYLSVVAVRGLEPMGLAMQSGGAVSKVASSGSGQSHPVEATALRTILKGYQQDIGQLRASLETRGQDSAVVASLAALEERMSIDSGQPVVAHATPVTAKASEPGQGAAAMVASLPQVAPTTKAIAVASVPAQPAPQPVSSNGDAKPAANAPVGTAAVPAGSVQPASIAMAPPALDKIVKPLETGSVGQSVSAAKPASTPAAAPTPTAPLQAAPIAFGPAIVKAEPKPVGIQLASGATLDAIQLSWSLLSEQHPDALRNLQPRFTTTGTENAGQTFDLMAGPVRSTADAKKICKTLAMRGTDCRVAEFVGEGF